MKRYTWLMMLTAALAGPGCLYNSDKAPWARQAPEAKPATKPADAVAETPPPAPLMAPVTADEVTEDNAQQKYLKLKAEVDRAERESRQ